jgi:16S rRNA (uracil1498-N3)-methyltransferase
MMRRTVVKLSDERAERRLRHWRGVVIAACEQCGRNHVPGVEEIRDASVWLRQIPPDHAYRFLLDPGGDAGLGELPAPDGPVLLLAGPEGGFDPAERDAAIRAGFRRIRLGPRILRTETAALAAIAAMQARWGDFR